MRMVTKVLVVVAILSILAPAAIAQEKAPGPAPAAKPLAELDALRIEKADADVRALLAEIQARQERIERVKEQVQRYVLDIAKRDGAEGCQLDMAKRQWDCKPLEEKKGEKP